MVLEGGSRLRGPGRLRPRSAAGHRCARPSPPPSRARDGLALRRQHHRRPARRRGDIPAGQRCRPRPAGPAPRRSLRSRWLTWSGPRRRPTAASAAICAAGWTRCRRSDSYGSTCCSPSPDRRPPSRWRTRACWRTGSSAPGSTSTPERSPRLVDKSSGRELVNTDSAFGFNAYLYDRYATVGRSNHNSSKFADAGSRALISSREVAGPAALLSATSDPRGRQVVLEQRVGGADA